MRTGYYYLYKYLILYIVLSFIDNKNIINCEKVKSSKQKMHNSNKELILDGSNTTRSIEDIMSLTNYSAMAQRSDFESGDGEHGVTCYTCVNVSNNHICNQFAIDRPCKLGNNFCHTLHIMDPHGGTVLVNKKCGNETECTPHSIGCYNIDNQKICISCCDEDYCNKDVPTKKKNATFRNSKTQRQKLLDSYMDRVEKNKLLRSSWPNFYPTLPLLLLAQCTLSLL